MLGSIGVLSLSLSTAVADVSFMVVSNDIALTYIHAIYPLYVMLSHAHAHGHGHVRMSSKCIHPGRPMTDGREGQSGQSDYDVPGTPAPGPWPSDVCPSGLGQFTCTLEELSRKVADATCYTRYHPQPIFYGRWNT